MAQPLVPRARKGVLAMKPEVSYGVDVFAGTYTSADIVPAEQIVPSPNLERLIVMATSGQLGRQVSAIGFEEASISWRGLLRGSAAAYSASVKPEWHNVIEGCSLIGTVDATAGAEKWTYAPSDTHKSQTIYFVQHIAGSATAIAIKLVGCFGDVEFSISAARFVEYRANFQGLISNIDDITYVGGTLVNTQYPVAKSALFQIGTENYAPPIANIGVRLGNVLQRRPSVNSAGGLLGFFIADRDPQVTIDPEADLEANYAWYTKWIAATLADCTFEAKGAVDYNRIQFSFPKMQIIAQPWGERDQLRSFPTTLSAVITAGNDDLSLIAAK